MPRYWLTIVMTLLLASLGGYVYFVELPSEHMKTETEAAEKQILPFAERDITGLTVRSDSGEIVLSGKDRSWQITAPLRAEADARAVEGVIRALVVGKVNRVVDEQGAALAPFGLEKPSVVLVGLVVRSGDDVVRAGRVDGPRAPGLRRHFARRRPRPRRRRLGGLHSESHRL